MPVTERLFTYYDAATSIRVPFSVPVESLPVPQVVDFVVVDNDPGQSSVDIPIPVTVEPGDLLIAGAGGEWNTGTDPPAGVGYTPFYEGNYGSAGLEIHSREAGAGDAGSDETWTAVFNRMLAFFMVVLRGVNTSSPLDVAITEVKLGPGDNYPQAPAITPTTDGCILLNIHGCPYDPYDEDTGYPTSYTGLWSHSVITGGAKAATGACYLIQTTAELQAQETWEDHYYAIDRVNIMAAIKPA